MNFYRLQPDEASKLIEEEWAPHEVNMYKHCKITPASAPSWNAEIHDYPDLGPSDTLYSTNNKNRPHHGTERDPIEDLQAINEKLNMNEDQFRFAPAEGDGVHVVPENVSAAIVTLWQRSEMRTPLLVPHNIDGVGSKDAAVEGISVLAKSRNVNTYDCAVSQSTDAQVADLADKCLAEGAWLIVHHDRIETAPAGEMPGFPIFRSLALKLMMVCPDPDNHPKREMFRLWVITPDKVNLNDTNYPPFPTVFTHQALQLEPSDVTGTKIVRKLPADPQLLEEETLHRRARSAMGREEDGESLTGDCVDNSCSPRKITGPIFVRSAEMTVHTSPQRERERLDFAQTL